MIVSFGDRGTGDLYHGKRSKRVRRYPPDLIPAALRNLDMVNAAHRLEDLRVPPANRLEALKGDLLGYHGVRVNDQWRIIFRWFEANAHEVRLTDYH